jgi:type I restriction enzyme S subunit
LIPIPQNPTSSAAPNWKILLNAPVVSISTDAWASASPPFLSEQRRIVKILDKAFANIAVAQANAEKNLQNARDLFASYLQSVFTRCGPKWVKKN